MKLGFGTYRVNPKNDNHLDAIKYAIDSGINIIEVSSHYSDNEIEKRIAPLINKETRLIVKVGYVQSNKFDELEGLEKRSENQLVKVHINESNYYCVDPLFLDQEIDLALKNLNLDSIDTLQLLNPENLFLDPNIDVYSEIKRAFEFLEQAVSIGKIKSYGISSNTFVLPREDKNVLNLETIVAKKNTFPNFKSIQFPFNLLELGALEKQFGGMNLIEFAKNNALEVIINRPLNAFTDKGLVRLAEYKEYANYNDEINPDELFNEKIKTLKARFDSTKEDPEDKLEDIALLKQIKGFWFKQISKDAVDQVFFGHFFPLVANIWGEDLSSDDSQDFYDLYDIACNYARKNMNTRAQAFKEQALESGLLDSGEQKLQKAVIDKYKSYGIDLCLIGMRRKSYVEDFL